MDTKEISKIMKGKGVQLIFNWIDEDKNGKLKEPVMIVRGAIYFDENGKTEAVSFNQKAEGIAKGLTNTIVKVVKEAMRLYKEEQKALKKEKKNGKIQNKTNRKAKKSV